MGGRGRNVERSWWGGRGLARGGAAEDIRVMDTRMVNQRSSEHVISIHWAR